MLTLIYNFYKTFTFLVFVIRIPIISCTPIVKGLKIKNEFFSNYDYMISLQERRGQEYVHLCGGVFINDQWIVTAAHCVYDRISTNLFIQVGPSIFQLSDQPRYSIEKIESHRFNEFTMTNDIALIQISSQFKNVTSHLELPNEITLFNSSNSCKILGFGSNIYGGTFQNTLYEANVNLITNKECISILGRIMGPQNGDNSVCAIGLNGEDACQGDSGGPLICNENDINYLYGIVSYGLSCGGQGIPSIYTVVGKYKSWIYDIILRG